MDEKIENTYRPIRRYIRATGKPADDPIVPVSTPPEDLQAPITQPGPVPGTHTKECKQCHQHKDVFKFRKSKTGKYFMVCMDCVSQRRLSTMAHNGTSNGKHAAPLQVAVGRTPASSATVDWSALDGKLVKIRIANDGHTVIAICEDENIVVLAQ